MQQNTKQRIVGTVVLLACCLIFLPIIFDGEGSYEPALTSRIPDPPQIPILPEPQQTRPVIIADSDVPSVALPWTDAGQPVSGDQANGTGEQTALTPAQEDTDVEPEVSESVSMDTRQEETIPQLGQDGLPNGWSVQMGAFANIDNATGLLESLKDRSYKAYIRETLSDNGSLHRVLVGPWLDREVSLEYLNRLQEDYPEESGIVVPFQMEQ